MLVKILNTLLMLVVALSITGVINRTRALLAGRKGIRFFQHIYNVRLQLRKGSVYSTTTTALFRIAPVVYLGSTLLAARKREETTQVDVLFELIINKSVKSSPFRMCN